MTPVKISKLEGLYCHTGGNGEDLKERDILERRMNGKTLRLHYLERVLVTTDLDISLLQTSTIVSNFKLSWEKGISVLDVQVDDKERVFRAILLNASRPDKEVSIDDDIFFVEPSETNYQEPPKTVTGLTKDPNAPIGTKDNPFSPNER